MFGQISFYVECLTTNTANVIVPLKSVFLQLLMCGKAGFAYTTWKHCDATLRMQIFFSFFKYLGIDFRCRFYDDNLHFQFHA